MDRDETVPDMRWLAHRSIVIASLSASAPSAAQLTAEQALANAAVLTAKPGCGASGAQDEIVVCARKQDELASFKLKESFPEEPVLPPAEFGFVGQTRLGVHADQVQRSDGMPDRRVKVTATIPF